MKLKHLLITGALLLGLAVGASAQGPYAAQIQAALRTWLASAQTVTGTWTWTDIVVSGNLDVLATGVRLSAADGVLTVLGQGNGNDENLTLDFDNAAANAVALATGTGVTKLTAVAIDFAPRHVLGGGGAPSVANVGANSCGTDAATIAGTDTAGRVTVGATSGTECRVTFAAAFATAPVCRANFEATGLQVAAKDTTTTTLDLEGTFGAAAVINYSCVGY